MMGAKTKPKGFIDDAQRLQMMELCAHEVVVVSSYPQSKSGIPVYCQDSEKAVL
jgi:hypothetical protein